MTGDVADVPAIISSKGGLKYAGADVDAMRAVAKAYQDRSLQEFQATLQARCVRCAHVTATRDLVLVPACRCRCQCEEAVARALPQGSLRGRAAPCVLAAPRPCQRLQPLLAPQSRARRTSARSWAMTPSCTRTSARCTTRCWSRTCSGCS